MQESREKLVSKTGGAVEDTVPEPARVLRPIALDLGLAALLAFLPVFIIIELRTLVASMVLAM